MQSNEISNQMHLYLWKYFKFENWTTLYHKLYVKEELKDKIRMPWFWLCSQLQLFAYVYHVSERQQVGSSSSWFPHIHKGPRNPIKLSCGWQGFKYLNWIRSRTASTWTSIPIWDARITIGSLTHYIIVSTPRHRGGNDNKIMLIVTTESEQSFDVT